MTDSFQTLTLLAELLVANPVGRRETGRGDRSR